MTASTNFPRPPGTINQESSFDTQASGLADLGAELVSIQDASGQYLSFYWQEGDRYGLKIEEMAKSQLSEIFKPVETVSYLQRLQQICQNLLPERFSCQFQYREKFFCFDLVVSPILKSDGTADTVLVMGRQKTQPTESLVASGLTADGDTAVTFSSQQYQKLLTKIARNIRRTLDLDTIWQQTVDGLGQALNVSRCIICPYKTGSEEAAVVAEYCQEAFTMLLGQKLKINEDSYLNQALETLEPVVVEKAQNQQYQQQSMLVVATFYKDQPNGLIGLHQCDRERRWQPAEVELVREIAEQVGTAIAHATLYEELEEARQQAEEASRLKSEFLANTSHELRTPLNGMIGFLKLILEGMAEDPEEQKEFIQEAYRSALHLLNIINDILDIAKIEAGKMELELGAVKIQELFSNVEDFTRAQAQQKQLSFRTQLPAAYDEIVVCGNYQRLLQVMLNLVGNAIKFTHEGGVTISAEVYRRKMMFREQEFPGSVKVRVVDTGIGVSLEKQDRLFQKFTQVDGGLNRHYGGTGLGLAISQKLIEAMGGTVNFFSMGEGLGSTVTFNVPLYQEPVMISKSPEAIDLNNAY